ncbi:MAG: hypothetical protein JXR63_07890 [Spirochaetales bacterium]|nr:hypothetical protein [Spirochaetales bacterium]
MIIPMKKVYIFMGSSLKSNSLKKIRNIGVLHPEPVKGQGENFQKTREDLELAQKALGLLTPDKKKDYSPVSNPFNFEEGLELAQIIVDTHSYLNDVKVEIQEIKVQIKKQSYLGDFSLEDLRSLNENGITLNFYSTNSQKTFDKVSKIGKIFQISKEGKKINFVELCYNSETKIFDNLGKKDKVEKVALPTKSMSELDQELVEKVEIEKKLESEMANLNESLREVEYLVAKLESDLEFTSLDTGISDDSEIAYFKGFVPVTEIEEFKSNAKKAQLGYAISDPDENDAVPTKLKNNRITGLIKPLFDFLAIVPGYKERDISMFMLPFFSLFFAMIIGDAGYGMIFLTICLVLIFINIVKRKPIAQALKLFTLLSVSTVVWGTLANTWFGSEAIGSIPFLKSLAIPALDAFDPRSLQFVQLFCFILACAHMGIAHIWNIITELRGPHKLKAVAQVGWISLMLGLLNVVLNLVVDGDKYPIIQEALILVGIGALLIVFFGQQEGKFFGGIIAGLKGLFTTFFDFIGMFSDIISYIRLFAVGLASVEVAISFNAMAAEAPIYIGVFILLLGHTINIVLGGLSVVVHGVRLNTLEFSGHLGQQWTGFEYKPFKTFK